MQGARHQPSRENQTAESPRNPGRFNVLNAGQSGQITYGLGNLFPFGYAGIISNHPVWTSDIARGAVLCRGVDNYGYVLDLYGGIHPAGTAPPITVSPYWGSDLARGIVMRSDCRTGYVLDAYGGLHPWAASGGQAPPAPTNYAYWPNWDIARGITYIGSIGGVDSGYVLDGYGGIHPWGNASPIPAGTYSYWPNWDIARGITSWDNAGSGYTLDGYGGVHPFGSAPSILRTTAYWQGSDIARGLDMWGQGTYYGYYSNTGGHLQCFYVTGWQVPMPGC